MALPPNFLDELRARTPIAALIGRSVRLIRSGRDVKACCPFHGEKTPSFYVYDDHFHCFGCGEHGDAITFVMKSTGAPFMEAVEQLAAEAGLEVPQASPQAAEAEQRRAGIAEVLEAAARLYQSWLFAPEGAAALAYLHGRGLSDETIRKFGLGWSGEGRGALAAGLRGQGINTEQLIAAGLMKAGDFGPVDYFFSRVMFPIRDRRGGMISFGGRIMGDGQPKYVNGPETAVFSKRRSLYGLNFARDAVRKGAALIVVEGYMDVIALAQAGFGGAVAPLGTALTEEQLNELWRLSPQPYICFDADRAGRAAALKAANLALPKLTSEQTLAFVRMPNQEDPDSIIRKSGKSAFLSYLNDSHSMVDTIFDFACEGRDTRTTAGRAQIADKLKEIQSAIQDKTISRYFGKRFYQRRTELWFGKKNEKIPGSWTGKRDYSKERQRIGPHITEKGVADEKRARIMTAILLIHPEIFPDVEEAFARLPVPADCEPLRDGLHSYISSAETLDTDSLSDHLTQLGLADQVNQIKSIAAKEYRIEPDLAPAEAAKTWWSLYILMDFSIEVLRQQRDEYQLFWLDHQDDPNAWARLVKHNELLQQARQGEYGGAES
jgi:DNA primase